MVVWSRECATHSKATNPSAARASPARNRHTTGTGWPGPACPPDQTVASRPLCPCPTCPTSTPVGKGKDQGHMHRRRPRLRASNAQPRALQGSRAARLQRRARPGPRQRPAARRSPCPTATPFPQALASSARRPNPRRLVLRASHPPVLPWGGPRAQRSPRSGRASFTFPTPLHNILLRGLRASQPHRASGARASERACGDGEHTWVADAAAMKATRRPTTRIVDIL